MEITTRKRFARGRTFHVVRHSDALDPRKVVKRALSRVGEDRYHLVFRNCEHFATWAVTGREESSQVRWAAAALAAVALMVLGGRVGFGRRGRFFGALS